MDRHDLLENFVQTGISDELMEFSPLVVDVIILSKDNSHIIININTLDKHKNSAKIMSNIIAKLEKVFNMKCIEMHHNSKTAFSLHFKIDDLDTFITLLKMKGVEGSPQIADIKFVNTLPNNPNKNTMYFITEA